MAQTVSAPFQVSNFLCLQSMQHVNLRALRRGFSSRFAFDPAAHHARRNNQTTLNRATRDAGLPLTGTLATAGNALGGSPPHPKGIRGAVALPVYSLRRSCSPQRHVHIVRKPPPESQLAGGGSGRGGEGLKRPERGGGAISRVKGIFSHLNWGARLYSFDLLLNTRCPASF